jgi:hypothetical protein
VNGVGGLTDRDNLMDALQGCKLAEEGLALQAPLNLVLFVEIQLQFLSSIR